MKRFWAEVTTRREPAATVILLDGKPMRLPGGPILEIPSAALAEAVAAEWRAVEGTVLQELLPLTRIAGTAQTRIAPDPGPTIDAIARYGETDLLCYRASAPAALAARQAQEWQKWIDWAATLLDAPLTVHEGVLHHPQPARSLERLHAVVSAYGAWRLAGLGILVPALGSLVLGLAVAEGALDARDAHLLALLDELFEAEAWGSDSEAEARRTHIGRDVEDAARFMALAG